MDDAISELVITFTTARVPALVSVDLFEKDDDAGIARSKLVASSLAIKPQSSCTGTKRIDAAAAKPLQPAGPKLRMTLSRPVGTQGQPVKNIVFESEINVLNEIGDGILSVFESESLDGLAQLPKNNKLREKMECLVGTATRKPIDLDYLSQTDLIYEFVRRKDTGAGRQDKVRFESIEQATLLLKSDFEAKAYTGAQEPAIAAVVRDLFDVGNGFCIMGPKYRWKTQLFCDIPKTPVAELFYNQPLQGLADDGTKVRDVFRVGSDAGKHDEETGDSWIEEKHLAIVSGYTKPLGHECVLAGDSKDILVRSGMGVSFAFEKCDSQLRDVVTCGGNPSMKTCHGFVAGIHDGLDGQVQLSILLALHKGNLPPFLQWHRLSQDAILQTNLAAIIPASWVVSTFHILPITLHPVPRFLDTDIFKIGNPACPIHREVYIAGHLDIFPGQTRAAQNPPPTSDLWSRRYENNNLKSFSLLSDFCLRGGAVTDVRFHEHAIWKERISGKIQSVSHFQPRAELHRVCTFPPEMALQTICASEALFAKSYYRPALKDLHLAVKRFAASKAKKAKNGTGSVCTLQLSISGKMLMQLVHNYAIVSAVRFKEGAIEAVVQQFHQAEELLGNIDGVFDCKSSGIVQLYAPITARYVLYNPKALEEDTNFVGSTGRAELEFSRFVGMDRMGAELTGDINVKDDADVSRVVKDDAAPDGGADGEAEGGCSGGAPSGVCHRQPPQTKQAAAAAAAVPLPSPGGGGGAGARADAAVAPTGFPSAAESYRARPDIQPAPGPSTGPKITCWRAAHETDFPEQVARG